MKLIQGITDKPNQTLVLPLDDGSSATLVLNYRDQQQGWFFDLAYGAVISRGNRLVTGPNALRHLKNLIPFGLLVDSVNNLEPLTGTVFSDGLTTLYLLDTADVAEVETLIYSGA